MPKVAVPTLREFVPTAQDSLMQGNHVTDVTWDGYERNLKLHLYPAFGDTPMNEIATRDIQRWVHAMREKGAGPATVHRSFSTLSSIMRVGTGLGYCDVISKRSIDMPKERTKRFPIATVAELELLADVIDPRYRAMVILCGYCGLRQGEVFGLRPSSIGETQITIWETLDRKRNRKDRTKGGSDRKVTTMPHVRAALDAHLIEYPNSEWVFHHNGKKIDHSWFYEHIWNPARIKSGVPTLRFQDLRHTACTVMVQLWGWSPVRVATEMGHMSNGKPNPGFTLSRYGHLWEQGDPGEQDSMAAALKKALRAVEGQKSKSPTADVKPRAGFEPATSRLQNSATASDWDLLAEIADGWHRNA